MKYRPGAREDLDEILALIASAIKTMEQQGIHQWNERYPVREDFEDDIEKETLYVVKKGNRIAAIYVINTECDEAYFDVSWDGSEKSACIVHRFCVSPDFQHQGVGKEVLRHIEVQAALMGYESIRLDVFCENPYAVRLYEKNGFVRRGYAHWRMGRFWLMEKSIV